MRYYQIAIWHSDIKTNVRGEMFYPKSMRGLSKKWSYTSIDDDGRPITSALDIYLDIPQYELGETRKGAMVRISGIGRDDISQFTHLVNAEIEIHAGMLSGYLPLSKGVKPDLLVRGTIFWANGNWEGTNTTLDLILVPVSGLDPDLRSAGLKNMTFHWLNGTKLSDAIRTTLANTYGKSAKNPEGYELDIKISNDLVQQSGPMPSVYYNLTDFAAQLKKVSKDQFPNTQTINGMAYSGVDITLKGKTIIVYDGTKAVSKWTKDNPKDIAFQDLIGQPGWKSAARLVIKTPMRADIALYDWIKLPKFLGTPYVITSGGGTQPANDPAGIAEPSKNLTTFSGGFEVTSIRHVGQFRQADAMNWVTVIECDAVPVNKKKTAADEPLASEGPPPQPESPHNEAQGSPLQTDKNNPTDPLRSQVPITPDYIPPPDFSTGR